RAGIGLERMAVAVALGPLVLVSSADREDHGVVAGRWGAVVAGRAVDRKCDLPRRRDGEPEGVPQAIGPHGAALRREGIVGGHRAVGVVAQHLAERTPDVLGLVGVVLLAEGDVELAVG